MLSNFTLAFLDDTGWYFTNHTAAAPLSWGANAGCSFVTADSCTAIEGDARARFFCTPPPLRGGMAPAAAARSQCTPDRLAVGVCSRLPLTPASEACFIVAPYSNWVCRDEGLNDADRARWGYSFGPAARCLAGGATPWSRVDQQGRLQYTQESATAGCFLHRCDAQGRVLVSLDRSEVPCPEGANVTLRDLKGLRFKAGQLGPCPSAAEVCPSLACPKDCSASGDCIGGRCVCWPGWAGTDCSVQQPA